MEVIQFQDDLGASLTMLEDAGYYFSPNVQPDHILNLQNFKARSDDTLVVTYPKSGTHWVNEIVSMLVGQNGSLTYEPIKHIEFLPTNILDAIPAPRVLCSHLPYPRIPLDFLRKRSKIVVCVRNPRDVAVSYYKFIENLNIWDYAGNWDSFFPLFLNGNLPYNSWFEHTDTWLRVAKLGKHNVHVVFYEDLHKDFVGETTRLAQFLEVEPTNELIQNVERETKFNNMKNNKTDITVGLSKDGTTAIYRKGQVGDWINWFMPEQVDQLDQETEAWGLHHEDRINYHVDGQTGCRRCRSPPLNENTHF